MPYSVESLVHQVHRCVAARQLGIVLEQLNLECDLVFQPNIV